VSLDQPIEIKLRRTRGKHCPNCDSLMIRFGGYEYKDKIGSSVSFIVGRVCKKCGVFYLNPRFKEWKFIFDKQGGQM